MNLQVPHAQPRMNPVKAHEKAIVDMLEKNKSYKLLPDEEEETHLAINPVVKVKKVFYFIFHFNFYSFKLLYYQYLLYN